MDSWWQNKYDVDPDFLKTFISWEKQKLTAKEQVYQLILQDHPSTILNCGCGCGYDYLYFKNILDVHKASWSGIEISDFMVNECLRAKIPITKGSITEMPFTNNHYDTVMAYDVFEHLEDFESGLLEMLRVARRSVYINFFKPPKNSTETFKIGRHVHVNDKVVDRMEKVVLNSSKSIKENPAWRRGFTRGCFYQHWNKQYIERLLCNNNTIAKFEWIYIEKDILLKITKKSSKHILLVGYGNWGRIWEKTILDSIHKLYMIIDPAVLGNSMTDVDYNQFDVAVIVTPINTHLDLARKLIEHKKDVLIEKPGTRSIEDIQTLKTLNHISKVNCNIGYVLVYLDCIKDLKQINTSWTRADFQRSNGGIIQQDCNVLYDLLCHDLALAYYLFQTYPTIIQTMGSKDEIRCILEFGSCTCHFYCSQIDTVKKSNFNLISETDSFRYDDRTKKALVNGNTKSYHVMPLQTELDRLCTGMVAADLDFGIVIHHILYDIDLNIYQS